MSAKFLLRPSTVSLAVALVCASAFAEPARVTSAPSRASPCTKVESGPVVKVPVGKARVLKLQSPVTRVLLGNPDESQAVRPHTDTPGATGGQQGQASPGASQQNRRRPGVADVDVLLLSPSEIYLIGKTVGATNIVMLDKAGRCTTLEVAVGIDTDAVKASLDELLPSEKGINVASVADSLVLSGTVSDAATVDRAVDIAAAYVRRVTGVAQMQGTRAGVHDRIINMLSVSAPQQVMLEVKVAEVSKALLDQYGINFASAAVSSNGTMMRFLSGIFGGKAMAFGQLRGMTDATVGFGAGAGVATGTTLAGVGAPFGAIEIENGAVTKAPIGQGKNATALGVDAQKQDGLVKILAEPTVMAISGQEGFFHAGGSVFLPVATNNGTGGTSITLEEKPFGVSLRFTPTVLADGRINLKVTPTVSELNPQGVAITATNVAGTSILPTFTVRKADTTVQLMDGQSFALGGLIKNNVKANLTAFPFLGELPVIGALFRSTAFQNDRSELVFVVTPRLVKPLPPNYALPTDSYVEPSRSDMILRGKLEGRRSDAPEQADAPAEPPAVLPAPPAGGGFEVK